MGSTATDIGLDLKLFAARTVAGFLKEASAMENGDGRVAKLEESVRILEEEKRKVEAFKRELPLCMHLLTDVIEGLKKEVDQCRGQSWARVFGEFLPIKRKFEEHGGVKLDKDSKEKMNWMSSAQLWIDDSSKSIYEENKNKEKVIEERGGELDRLRKEETSLLESKSLSGGGAFVPFKGLLTLAVSSTVEEKPAVKLTDLLRGAPVMGDKTLTLSTFAEGRRSGGSGSKGIGRDPASTPARAGDHLSPQAQQQPRRKMRRCWSPELHRQFLFALQQLGGAQSATPKQIRDLMKVDDLTNDEVKSHLQKYRLHARRVANSSEAMNQPAAVRGSVGVPEEQYSASSQQSASHSGSPQSPLQLGGSTGAISVTAGDSCEEEDGKSENRSWK